MDNEAAPAMLDRFAYRRRDALSRQGDGVRGTRGRRIAVDVLRSGFVFVALLAAQLLTSPAQAARRQDGQGADPAAAPAQVINREMTLKAAVIFNFGHHIAWPDDDTTPADAPFVIGVFGKHDTVALLQQVAKARKRRSGKAGVERPVVIEEFDSVDAITPTHILFVARTVTAVQIQALTTALANRPTLLVGEDDAFLDKGGMINLGIKDNKIHLSVSLPALEKAHLKPAAALLRITPDVRK